MRCSCVLALCVPLAFIPVLLIGADVSAGDCSAVNGSELVACIEQAAAGDTITMQAGTFAIGGVTITDLHGTSAAPIVIQGTLGDDGSRLSHIIGHSIGSNTIEIRNSSYLEFRDFELSHAAGTTGNSVDLIKFAGAGKASHHVTIVNLDVHDCGNVAISSQATEIHDVSVRNSHVHDIGGSCFYWGYYESEGPQRKVHHSEIVRNLLQRCPQSDASETHYGVQLKSGNHDNRIEDNVLVDVAGTTRAGIAVYHSAPKPVGSPLEGNNVVRGNMIIRSRNEGINASAGAVIENNIVVDAAGIAIFLQPRSYGGATYYGSLRVRNNTVFQTGHGEGIRFSSSAWENADQNRPSEFVGNLVLIGTGNGLRPPSDTATVDKNATNGIANGAAGTIALSDATEAVMTTTFGEVNYLYPVSDGPLVDVDVDPASVIDFNLTARDTRSDVGAYEWAGDDNPGWILDEDGFKLDRLGSNGITGTSN